MTDFNQLINLNQDIITTFKGKTLILHNCYLYQGPLTMQYLPFGGIQSTYGHHVIITTKNGFIACDLLTYDCQLMTSKEFINKYDDLVNTILPN